MSKKHPEEEKELEEISLQGKDSFEEMLNSEEFGEQFTEAQVKHETNMQQHTKKMKQNMK